MRPSTLVALLLSACLANLAKAQCVPIPQSGSPLPGIVGTVTAATSWDPDGPGPAPEVVAMVGTFASAGGAVTHNAAAYDPATRTIVALGALMPPNATCLTASPTGALFAGTATGQVLAWTGSEWRVIGGAPSGGVRALCAHSNGDLYAGGSFAALGGAAAPLVRWNGANWASLGQVTRAGAAPVVEALVEMPSGDLVAAGQFDTIGGVAMTGLARWNGSAWSSPGVFGGGTPSLLTVDAAGDLVVSGTFQSVGGTPVGHAAKWNGSTWSDFSAGLPTWPSFLATSGGTLLAGLGSTIGTWNGTNWAPLPSPPATEPRSAMKVAGGDLLALGAPVAGTMLGGNRWHLGAWETLASGTNGPVFGVAALPDGSWAIAGNFSQIGAVNSVGIAQGGASGYANLATPQVHGPAQLVVLPNGEIAALSGGNVWNWNGAVWSQPGSMSWPSGYGIQTMAAAPGNHLLVGKSELPQSSGAELWTWDGTSWTTETLPGSAPGQTRTLLVLGVLPNGDRVIAGNTVLPPAVHIATFDGTNLTPLGAGPDNTVLALLVRGNGDIVIGGAFSSPFPGIARWDGSAWQPLGGGIQGMVNAIAELPNGDLLVGGNFAAAGRVPAPNLARWNGASWSAFAASPTGPVYALGVARNGEVAVGGGFLRIGNSISSRIGFYPPACPATATSYGAGCAGATGTVALAATSLPWLGSTCHATTTGHAVNSLVLSVRGLAPLALPLASVLPQGGAGCQLLVSPDLIDIHVATTTSLDLAFAIPSSMSLVGQSLRQQVVPLQLTGGGAIAGLQSSNALTLTIGSL